MTSTIPSEKYNELLLEKLDPNGALARLLALQQDTDAAFNSIQGKCEGVEALQKQLRAAPLMIVMAAIGYGHGHMMPVVEQWNEVYSKLPDAAPFIVFAFEELEKHKEGFGRN